jgi:hypothetical protein
MPRISQAIHVAAKLGIADLVQKGPVRHATSPGSFGLTPMAELLRATAPNSMRALAFFTVPALGIWARTSAFV